MPSSISTVRLVGVPSSSIDSEPRRAAMVPSSTTVTPMADRLVQHHAGPAGAEHHVHLAGGRGNRFQIDQGLADRAVGGVAPGFGLDEACIALAAAITLAAAFLPVALHC